MTVDPEIIKDLLPLYRSGLASPPSRRLVEAWLAEHKPDCSSPAEMAGASDAELLRALEQARRLRRRLRWLFGLAIGLTVFCLSMEIRFEAGVPVSVELLALRMPLAFAPAIVAALACWTGYLTLRRRLR